MRITLIHNPGAGSGTAAGSRKSLIRLITEAGHEVTYCSSKDGSWKEYLDQPADLIAVAGGDGIVGRVARRSVKRGVPIAILPLGTANNISHSTGNWGMSIATQVSRWAQARYMDFDAVLAQGPWGTRTFVEGAGLGLFARAMASAEGDSRLQGITRPAERLRFAVRKITDMASGHPAAEIRATLDGRDISGHYLLFEAMNIRHVGPNLPLAPRARADDGLIDVVTVHERARTDLKRRLRARGSSAAAAAQTTGGRMRVLRGKILQLEWDKGHLHLDDKSVPHAGRERRAVTISVIPGALKVLKSRG